MWMEEKRQGAGFCDVVTHQHVFTADHSIPKFHNQATPDRQEPVSHIVWPNAGSTRARIAPRRARERRLHARLDGGES